MIDRTDTERQTAALVRVDGPIVDPAWVVRDVDLEEIVLGYLGAREGLSAPGRPDIAGRSFGGGIVIWVTWRQHRAQALATLIGLGAIGVFLLITGPRIASAFQELHACLAVPGQNCGFLHESFDQRFNGLRFVIPVFMVVPLLLGVFLGAPLIAREVEQGTHRLAWTQSVTRGRWATTKIGLVAAFTHRGAGLFAWMVTIWSSPLVAAADDRFGFGVFDLRGIVPIAYALFAFALGTAVGASIRKTLPAMAITLGVFAAVRIVVELFLRPRYLPTQTISYPFVQNSPRAGLATGSSPRGSSIRPGDFVSPNGADHGQPVGAGAGVSRLVRPGVFPGKDQVGSCLVSSACGPWTRTSRGAATGSSRGSSRPSSWLSPPGWSSSRCGRSADGSAEGRSIGLLELNSARDVSVPLSIVHRKEPSPDPANPLTARCRARGGARRVFVVVGHFIAAGRADLEPGSTANVRRTLAARPGGETDSDHVSLVEDRAAQNLPQHPCRGSPSSSAHAGDRAGGEPCAGVHVRLRERCS